MAKDYVISLIDKVLHIHQLTNEEKLELINSVLVTLSVSQFDALEKIFEHGWMFYDDTLYDTLTYEIGITVENGLAKLKLFDLWRRLEADVSQYNISFIYSDGQLDAVLDTEQDGYIYVRDGLQPDKPVLSSHLLYDMILNILQLIDVQYEYTTIDITVAYAEYTPQAKELVKITNKRFVIALEDQKLIHEDYVYVQTEKRLKVASIIALPEIWVYTLPLPVYIKTYKPVWPLRQFSNYYNLIGKISLSDGLVIQKAQQFIEGQQSKMLASLPVTTFQQIQNWEDLHQLLNISRTLASELVVLVGNKYNPLDGYYGKYKLEYVDGVSKPYTLTILNGELIKVDDLQQGYAGVLPIEQVRYITDISVLYLDRSLMRYDGTNFKVVAGQLAIYSVDISEGFVSGYTTCTKVSLPAEMPQTLSIQLLLTRPFVLLGIDYNNNVMLTYYPSSQSLDVLEVRGIVLAYFILPMLYDTFADQNKLTFNKKLRCVLVVHDGGVLSVRGTGSLNPLPFSLHQKAHVLLEDELQQGLIIQSDNNGLRLAVIAVQYDTIITEPIAVPTSHRVLVRIANLKEDYNPNSSANELPGYVISSNFDLYTHSIVIKLTNLLGIDNSAQVKLIFVPMDTTVNILIGDNYLEQLIITLQDDTIIK